MSRRIRALAAPLLALVLAGCGWHLRGSGVEGLQGRAVTLTASSGLDEVRDLVRRQLRGYGAELAATGSGAPVLELVTERTPRRALATDSRGRAVEYQLNYQLVYRVHAPAVQGSGQQGVASAEGSYEVDGEAALAEQGRRERLLESLRAEAVRRMLARLAVTLPESR